MPCSESAGAADGSAPPAFRPSEKIRAILTAAASSRELLEMLMVSPEQALAKMGLSDEEKAEITSLGAERLRAMVKRQARQKGPWRALRSRVVALGAVIALLVFVNMTRVDRPAQRARSALIQILIAEQAYTQEYGAYGELDDLFRAGGAWLKEELERNIEYDFAVELAEDGETFTATARHTTRPDDRPAYQVRPSGTVVPLE